MNLYTSSFFFLNSKYISSFLGTNLFFISIAWSHSFFVSILSLAFLPKTWIYLWFSDTNFFASIFDFAISSSLFQISHFLATLLTSTIFFFSFYSFSSCFFPSSSFLSVSFCFCYPNFPCFDLHYFLHSSGHLVIFTSSVLQSILELWQASHGISRIIFYFCLFITLIYVLFLCLW